MARVPNTVSATDADPWYVYVMQCSVNRKRVYTGATNNPVRRRRQHRGELAGGAQTTARWGPGNAEMVILVGPFPDTGSVRSKIAALSFEKKMKVAKVGAGISGRVKTLMKLLSTANGRVTRNVNLNQYSLKVATRMTRQDFALYLSDPEWIPLAYSPNFTYNVSLGSSPVVAIAAASPAPLNAKTTATAAPVAKSTSAVFTGKGVHVQHNQGIITNYFM